jgi:MFS family permease
LLCGVFATIGGQIQGVAVGWELYQRTSSAWSLGLVGLVQFLPLLFLALPAGHAADRYSRKRLFLLAHALMFLASTGLCLLSFWSGPVWPMYVCLLLSGIGQSFSMPARWALLSEVVPIRLLSGAVTWNTSCWQLASVAGPALGGAVIGWTKGATAAYFLDAGCSLAVLLLMGPIRPRTTLRASEPISIRSLLAGLRFVCRTELILATITLDLFAVLLGGATALLPVFARDRLDVGPAGLGWLTAAPSVGASLMALVQAHRPPLRRAGSALLWAVAGFGAATIVFGISRNPYLSFLMLLLIGALDNISVVVRSTLVQVLTPDPLRGRVSAVNAIFIGSSNKLGAFESGATAQWFGPVASVVGGGIGTILVVVATALIWPPMRQLGSLHRLSREAMDGDEAHA